MKAGRNAIRWAVPASMANFDLATFLFADRAGYINGEMVVQDGGAHLRSSSTRRNRGAIGPPQG